MNEAAIQALIQYMNEYLFEPKANWPKEYFRQRVYSRWAANEILGNLISHPFTSPTEIVYLFMIKMMTFSFVNEDSKASLMFSIITEVAEDILELFSELEN